MAVDARIPNAAHELRPQTHERLTRPFQRFSQMSSSGGLVLLGCTIMALAWANSKWHDTYHHVFHEIELALTFGSWSLAYGIGHWINDLLMAIFFVLVGLEIKREMVVGELADVKRAALPIAGAIGGMAIPAIIYVMFNLGQSSISGWGVPMATDIAFALGILALLGNKVPNSLKVFLTSLAIVDDLGALLVIAIFYTENLSFVHLGAAGGVTALLVALNLMGFRRGLWFVVPGMFLWYFFLKSGVHATIAGVVLAMTIPVSSRVDASRYIGFSRSALDAFEKHSRPGQDIKTNSAQRAAVHAIEKNSQLLMPLLHRMEHLLHPWVAFAIIPVFALANAGLHVESGVLGAMAGPISLGVILGLFIGKPLGVVGASWLACKIGLATLPRGVTWRQMIGVGWLAGIGFTMALFIANLGFGSETELSHAKMGILVASTLSAVVGLAVLVSCPRKPEPEPETLGPRIDFD